MAMIETQDAIDAVCGMLGECFDKDAEVLDAVATTLNEVEPVQLSPVSMTLYVSGECAALMKQITKELAQMNRELARIGGRI